MRVVFLCAIGYVLTSQLATAQPPPQPFDFNFEIDAANEVSVGCCWQRCGSWGRHRSVLIPLRSIGAGHDLTPTATKRKRHALHRLTTLGTAQRHAANEVDFKSVFVLKGLGNRLVGIRFIKPNSLRHRGQIKCLLPPDRLQ